jgi:hypothetical protein
MIAITHDGGPGVSRYCLLFGCDQIERSGGVRYSVWANKLLKCTDCA